MCAPFTGNYLGDARKSLPLRPLIDMEDSLVHFCSGADNNVASRSLPPRGQADRVEQSAPTSFQPLYLRQAGDTRARQA